MNIIVFEHCEDANCCGDNGNLCRSSAGQQTINWQCLVIPACLLQDGRSQGTERSSCRRYWVDSAGAERTRLLARRGRMIAYVLLNYLILFSYFFHLYLDCITLLLNCSASPHLMDHAAQLHCQPLATVACSLPTLAYSSCCRWEQVTESTVCLCFHRIAWDGLLIHLWLTRHTGAAIKKLDQLWPWITSTTDDMP